ncbi:MAG: PKD repeat protein [Sphingobacteriales bacterium]|jgi:PKD repeat protein
MKKLIFAFIVFLATVSPFNSASAQLPGWSSAVIFDVFNGTNADVAGKPIILTVNTKDLIELGQLQENAADIRFASDCEGATLFDYWIESGVNTENTQIYVRGLNIPAGDSTSIYLIYGNPTAAEGSNFDAVFVSQRIISANEELTALDTVIDVDYFEITGGVVVTLGTGHPGKVTVNASRIKIDGVLNLTAKGFAGSAPNVNGEGPGGGGANPSSFGAGGGGAGYGGKGGHGSSGGSAQGGVKYGTTAGPDVQKGSGGGGGDAGIGGAGGGAVTLVATGVNIKGDIRVNGEAGAANGGSAGGGGGGSGGGILIIGQHLAISGDLYAQGGDGGPAGNWPGGGGGGGRVKTFFGETLSHTGKIYVEGGLVSKPYSAEDVVEEGRPGTSSSAKQSIGFITSKISSLGIGLISDQTVICAGTNVTYDATGSFSTFEFFVNNALIQTGESPKFEIETLTDSAVIAVENYDPAGGCKLRSKTVFMRVSYGPPKAKFEADFNKLEVNFMDESLSPITWAWDFGDSLGTSTEQNPFYKYGDGGNYDVTLLVTNGCGENTLTKPYRVSVLSSPLVDFEFKTIGDSTYFTDKTQNEVLNWKWDLGDGDSSDVQNPVHSYSGPGPFIVCLMADNVFGADTVCKVVELIQATGIASAEASFDLVIAPNPVRNQLKITSSEEIKQLEIYNLQGQRLFFAENKNTQQSIEVSSWAKGVYVLKAFSQNGIAVSRFIVE